MDTALSGHFSGPQRDIRKGLGFSYPKQLFGIGKITLKPNTRVKKHITYMLLIINWFIHPTIVSCAKGVDLRLKL